MQSEEGAEAGDLCRLPPYTPVLELGCIHG